MVDIQWSPYLFICSHCGHEFYHYFDEKLDICEWHFGLCWICSMDLEDQIEQKEFERYIKDNPYDYILDCCISSQINRMFFYYDFFRPWLKHL